MRKILLCLISVSLFCSLGSAASTSNDDEEFQKLETAVPYFLNKKNLIDAERQQLQEFKNYSNLHAMTLDQIFSEPNAEWKVYRIANYDWRGIEIPAQFYPMQISEDGTTKSILFDGYYFIYKDSFEKGPRLIVQVDNDNIYYPADDSYASINVLNISYTKENFGAAEEFKKLLFEYLNGPKNRLRSGVLHFEGNSYSATFQLKFMQNIERSNLKWDDLILPREINQLAAQNTEGFVKLFEEARAQGITAKKGILLEGPPGTGKSLLGQVLISSMQSGDLKGKATFFVVTARHLAFKHTVKALFEEAVRLAPSIIFMEDMDLLGIRSRNAYDSDSNVDANKEDVLNEFLNAIDGVVDHDGLLLIGTTNRIKNIDYALLRSERMGMHLHFGLPTYADRKIFFERFGVKHAIWAEDVSSEWLADYAEGMSGADIVEAISIAKQSAMIGNSWSEGKLYLTKAHFQAALDMVRDGTTDDSMSELVSRKRPKLNLEKAMKLLDTVDREIENRVRY